MLRFKYETKEQEERINKAIEDCLIGYGATSTRAKEGKSYIMPYFENEEGEMTARRTGRIGGVGIPEDLVEDFVKRFVELDRCKIKVGNETIKDKCPEDIKRKVLFSKFEELSAEENELDSVYKNQKNIRR